MNAAIRAIFIVVTLVPMVAVSGRASVAQQPAIDQSAAEIETKFLLQILDKLQETNWRFSAEPKGYYKGLLDSDHESFGYCYRDSIVEETLKFEKLEPTVKEGRAVMALRGREHLNIHTRAFQRVPYCSGKPTKAYAEWEAELQLSIEQRSGASLAIVGTFIRTSANQCEICASLGKVGDEGKVYLTLFDRDEKLKWDRRLDGGYHVVRVFTKQ